MQPLQGFVTYMRWRLGITHTQEEHLKLPPYVPQYATPDIARIKNPDPSSIQLTWVGHATFLIQVAGMNILTDPIWSKRASPMQFAGPTRYARPGVAFEDLPKIDLILISHTHYDHLDRPTIHNLGNAPHYIIPDHTKEWFEQEGITNSTELRWGQSTKVGALTVHAVPARHWSKRKLFGTENAGWGGYLLDTPAGQIYFVGDTGYDSGYFKEIGKRFPSISLALIPIGAYYPGAVFGNFHINPGEAVVVHKEVGAKKSVGMHWGVFKLTGEPLNEPPLLLAREIAAAGIPPEEFSVMKIGETRSV